MTPEEYGTDNRDQGTVVTHLAQNFIRIMSSCSAIGSSNSYNRFCLSLQSRFVTEKVKTHSAITVTIALQPN